MPTIDRHATRGAARPAADNRYEQVRRALDRLERAGRIQTARSSGRERFKGFSLLDESSDNLRETTTAYSLPDPDLVQVIDVPVEFFVNGWVHALTQGGRALSTEQWSLAFGTGRGARGGLVAQRALQRFGLIRVERPEDRRADGSVEGAGSDGGAELPWEAHYYVPHEEGLHSRAVPWVLSALEGCAQARPRRGDDGVHAAGRLDLFGAVAELEQDALAAPTPPSRVG